MEVPELILYTSSKYYDPVTAIARIWTTLTRASKFGEYSSHYTYTGHGQLPMLLIEDMLISKDHILPFLKQFINLNYDLSEEEEQQSILLEEACVSKLHPATLFAAWMDPETGQGFLRNGTHWLIHALGMPFRKLGYYSERRQLDGYFTHQHHIKSQKEAFFQVEETHSLLSKVLGNKPFFFSKEGRRDYPRSTDIVVFAYLSEEIALLGQHKHLTESLQKHQNLIDFLNRMHELVSMCSLSAFHQDEKKQTAYAVLPNNFEELPFPPAIPYNLEFLKSNRINMLRQRDETQVNQQSTNTQSAINRGYIALSSMILLGFLIIKF